MFLNRGSNQQLPPVTFGKMDLLAIAKWLLSVSPLFFVPTTELGADWAYNCLPLVRTRSSHLKAYENENKLIGKLKVIINISCGPFPLALVKKVQKVAKHWQIFQVWCPRPKLPVYRSSLGILMKCRKMYDKLVFVR